MSSQIFKSPLPYLSLILAHIIWGSTIVVGKFTLHEFPVMSLGFIRFSLAFILLLPFVLTLEKKDRRIYSKDFVKFLLMGIMLITFPLALFYEGLSRTSAINASSLVLIMPIVSVLIGWWFLKEKIFWINLVGIIVGFAGTMVMIGIPLIFFGELTSSILIGNFLILISAVSTVVGTVLSKDLLKSYHSLVITAGSFLVGGLVFFIPAVFEYIKNPSWISQISILGAIGVTYMTFFSAVLGYFLLNFSLKRINLIHAHLFQYVEPAITASLAIPLLGERVSYSFIIGTCLIVLGVYWGTLGKTQHNLHHFKHHRF